MEAVRSKSETFAAQTANTNTVNAVVAERYVWNIAMAVCVKASPLLPPNVPNPPPHDILQGATGSGVGAYAGSAAPSPVSLGALWAAAEAGNWATASWLLLRQRGQDCCHELLPFFTRKAEEALPGIYREAALGALRWLEGELERAPAG